MRLQEILRESKNVIFGDTEPFDPSGPVAKKIHDSIEKILSPLQLPKDADGYTVSPVGSAFRPRRDALGQAIFSGDWDGQIDAGGLVAAFASDAPRDQLKVAKQALATWLRDKGYSTRVMGITVHVRLPIDDKFYQVDLEVVSNREHVKQFHRHEIPQTSAYKGVHKHLFLRALAKSKNMLWSPWEGLYARDEQGVKGPLISTDPQTIAQKLFGNQATAATLDNLENMIQALPQDVAQETLELAKQDRGWI